MADHRSSGARTLAFAVVDPDAARGRHRAPAQGHGTGVKAATLAAATGAIFVGGAQFATATASAATIDVAALPADVTAGLKSVGVEVPATVEVPDFAADAIPGFATAKQWLENQPTGSTNPLPARTVQPVNGTLTSDYGSRWGAHHGGIDIAAPIGTPVLAAEDGTVISAGEASGFGLWVRVMHEDRSITVYGHINDYRVSVGQKVSAGEQIATVGNRGQSTGPHLHFEVWDPQGNKTDPSAWLRDNGVSVTWGNNGRNV
ncbi:Peptidase M23 family protein [Rhodococcus sp. RD6.2]|uniref:M23 family metallopeptidase n=1 Tax=Rhodococcus sp. RD6.2 TaxID=260936 RepID=UPI00063B428C|nr:M23 family metallopeptidase [Rhodococcus sp. RD6.2]CRK49555.1 Peptidase M23 family protein [Rhodococcus sp. RD6.2]